MGDTVSILDGFTTDLDEQYRTSHAQSVIDDDLHVFHVNSNEVRAVKRLPHELFDVWVRDTMHPVNNRVRKEAEIRMAALGWTAKGTRRVPDAMSSSAGCNGRHV